MQQAQHHAAVPQNLRTLASATDPRGLYLHGCYKFQEQPLGEGGYGIVHDVSDMNTGQRFACKSVRKHGTHSSQVNNASK